MKWSDIVPGKTYKTLDGKLFVVTELIRNRDSHIVRGYFQDGDLRINDSFASVDEHIRGIAYEYDPDERAKELYNTYASEGVSVTFDQLDSYRKNGWRAVARACPK